MDQPEEKVIKLRKPVVLGTGDNAITYETLTLREPLAGELEKATATATNNVGMSITLIHLVAGIPRAAVARIGQRDLREASDYLGGFTEDGPTTGQTE
jgi:hypothetical protein